MKTDLSNAKWFTSTRSGAAGHCVEVAFLEHNNVAVRHSKDRTGPALVFTPAEWNAFVGGAQDGEFNLG